MKLVRKEEFVSEVGVNCSEESGVFPMVRLLNAEASTSEAPTQAMLDKAADLELVTGMIVNDARAWRNFQERYNRLVHRCILKVTRRFTSIVSAEDVREIHAQLMLSLLANDKYKLRTFDPERGNRFSSWIGLLAINCAYDYLRALKREPNKTTLSEASELVCDLPDPFETTSNHERAEIAAEMMADFSDRDRKFAALYFGEGMDPVEIAKSLNISVKTVYSKKHKIRTRLETVVAAA
jgi:RNA polymerase sigma-70 factor (ECF subfamily)